MGVLSWIAIISLFFYLTPFLRLASRPLRAVLAPKQPEVPLRLHPFLVKIGRIEYLLGPLRDRLLSIVLLGIVVYLWIEESPLSAQTLLASSLIIFFNLLAIITIRYRDGIRLKLAEVARCHSTIHPEEFFNIFYAMMSPWPPPFPWQGFREVKYNEADYRTGNPSILARWPLIEASISTSTLARMAMLAFKRVGPEYGRDAFDGLARLWGSRVAQVFNARLHTDGAEQIPMLDGKTLLLFNHKSTLDFGLNFFALGMIRTGNDRQLRPRFIAARDHFIENPFIYSWVGLGKVIENAGMIFINRKKGKGWAAMEEAAQRLINTDVEIAVYPQGTRAYGMVSPQGERLDSGYYSTFATKSWDKPLGHLKVGTATLILNTLIELRKRGEKKLNVLVVGLMGTGKAVPKGSFKIETECEILFRLGPLWEVPTSWAEGVEIPQGEARSEAEHRYQRRIEEIQAEINRRLLTALQWHTYLRERLVTELKHLGLDQADQDRTLAALDAAEAAGDATPHILLDRIFSLKPELWERFLRLFVSLIGKPGEVGSWRAVLQEVSERLGHR